MKADQTISDLFSWKAKLFNWKLPFDMYIIFCYINYFLSIEHNSPQLVRFSTWKNSNMMRRRAVSIYARATGRKPRSSKRFCDWKCSCNRDREFFFDALKNRRFLSYIMLVCSHDVQSERNKLLKCHYFLPHTLKDSWNLFWSKTTRFTYQLLKVRWERVDEIEDRSEKPQPLVGGENWTTRKWKDA